MAGDQLWYAGHRDANRRLYDIEEFSTRRERDDYVAREGAYPLTQRAADRYMVYKEIGLQSQQDAWADIAADIDDE